LESQNNSSLLFIDTLPFFRTRDQQPSRARQFLMRAYTNTYGMKKSFQKFKKRNFYQLQYYRHKVQKNVHWRFAHGGRREESSKCSLQVFKQIQLLMKILCWKKPSLTLWSYQQWIQIVFGISYSISKIHFIFTNVLGYSRKKVKVILFI
jgi:hypothetical protein